ncbi:MAG: hypothetical protein KGY38_05995 [Desulfobacterales bacterium]|nr:hypothetical protein [Desulfobacterales bacterium]
MLQLIGAFISGLFLFNAIPHMVQGICGKSHMTPFARRSRPVVNVIWAWINIIIGMIILKASLPQACSWVWGGAFFLGCLVISIYLAFFWSDPEARLPWHKD